MRTQRGFSLIEVVVTLAIVSVLMLIVYSMIEDTVQATLFNESHNDLAILSQRAVNFVHEEIIQTRAVFEENATGSAYRAALQIPASYPRWTTSLLPVIDPATTLAPDAAADRFTGNSLLIARQLAPLSVMYDDDNNPLTPEVEFMADRYRFEYFFLSPISARALDLLRSESVVFADYFQLNALSNAHIRAIVPKLRTAGLNHAWNPGQPVDSAFYDLADALDGNFNPPVNRPTLAVQRTVSLFPELRGGRISGKMDYSIAREGFPIRAPVNLYARPHSTRPGFPAGFEVKIAGPSGNRQVMTRVLMMSNYHVNRWETQQAFVVTAARF